CEETSYAVRDLRHGRHRRREPRLRLGLGDRQPDDLLGLLRRAGPGRAADAPDPPGAGHGHLRHADPSRARGGDGDAEPAGAGPVHLGIGTGNTAMGTMGQRPMRIAEYDEYLRVLAALLRGETVDYRYHDRVRPISASSRRSRSPSRASARARWSWPARTATGSSSPSRPAASPSPTRSATHAREPPARAARSTASAA